MTDKRIMKVTEAVFERIDSRIATELAGAYDAWISFGFFLRFFCILDIFFAWYCIFFLNEARSKNLNMHGF